MNTQQGKHRNNKPQDSTSTWLTVEDLNKYLKSGKAYDGQVVTVTSQKAAYIITEIAGVFDKIPVGSVSFTGGTSFNFNVNADQGSGIIRTNSNDSLGIVGSSVDLIETIYNGTSKQVTIKHKKSSYSGQVSTAGYLISGLDLDAYGHPTGVTRQQIIAGNHTTVSTAAGTIAVDHDDVGADAGLSPTANTAGKSVFIDTISVDQYGHIRGYTTEILDNSLLDFTTDVGSGSVDLSLGESINVLGGDLIETAGNDTANSITINHSIPVGVSTGLIEVAGTFISGLTVDLYGHLTGIETQSIAAGNHITITKTVTTNTINHAAIGSTATTHSATAGSYISSVSKDNYGHVVGIGETVLPNEDLNFSGDTGSGVIDLETETLNFSGGTAISTIVTGNQVEIKHSNVASTVATGDYLTSITVNTQGHVTAVTAANFADLTGWTASDGTNTSGVDGGDTFTFVGGTGITTAMVNGINSVTIDLSSNNISQFTNDSGYLTSASLTGYLPLTGGTLTGALTVNNALTTLRRASNIPLTLDRTTTTGLIFELHSDGVAKGQHRVNDTEYKVQSATGISLVLGTGTGEHLTINTSGNSTFFGDATIEKLTGGEVPVLTFKTSEQAIVDGTELGKISWSVHDNSAGRVQEEGAYIKFKGTNTWTATGSASAISFGIRNSNTAFLDNVFTIENDGDSAFLYDLKIGDGTIASNRVLRINAPTANQASIIFQKAGVAAWQFATNASANDLIFYNSGLGSNAIKAYAATNDVEIPVGTLTIGEITLPKTDGAANQGLITDGAGTVSFAAIAVANGGANQIPHMNGAANALIYDSQFYLNRIGSAHQLFVGDNGSYEAVIVGDGSGSVAISTNDGAGNANVTFNNWHDEIDSLDTTQSAARISASTDSSTMEMLFSASDNTYDATELAKARGSRADLALTKMLSLTLTEVTTYVPLKVNDAYTLPSSLGAADQVLGIDGFGNADLVWITPATVGGTANEVVYSTGSAFAYITAPSTADTYLSWNGSAFAWTTISESGAVNYGSDDRIPYMSGGAFVYKSELSFVYDPDNLSNATGYGRSYLSVPMITLSNREKSDITAAYQIALDANDSNAPARLGTYLGTDPMGIYVSGDGTNYDNGGGGVYFGLGTVQVWHTGHFGATQVTNWETAYNDHVVSAAYSAGTLTFTQNDGGTFTATGLDVGTVTQVGLSVPTGFTVGGSPVTTNGTLAITFASGYSLPTNANQTNWSTAYTHSLVTSGNPHGTGYADISDFSAGVSTYETSHANVVVDGDFISNGLMKRTAAGVYAIITDDSTNWTTAYNRSITSVSWNPAAGDFNFVVQSGTLGPVNLDGRYTKVTTGTVDRVAFFDGAFSLNSGSLYWDSATSRLGIGISPTYKLDVNGSAGFNDYIYHNGDSDTHFLLETNSIKTVSGLTINFQGTSTLTSINPQNTLDLSINNGLVYVDQSASTVGINTSTPNSSYTFHANGSSLISGDLTVDSTGLESIIVQSKSATGDSIIRFKDSTNTVNQAYLGFPTTAANLYLLNQLSGELWMGTNSGVQLKLTTTNLQNTTGVYTGADSADYISIGANETEFYTNSARRLITNASGVAAEAYLTVGLSTVNTSYRIYVNGEGYATADWTVSSDERKKEFLDDIPNALNLLMEVKPFRYKHIEIGDIQLGYGAQSLNKIVPEAVSHDKDVWGIKYRQMTALNTKGIQELNIKVDSEVDRLKRKVAFLEKEIQQLKENKQ